MTQPTAEQTHPALQMLHLTNQDGVMILVGLVFIYALYFTLSKKLFAPLLAHLEHREGVTAGALHSADLMRQKGQALRARYDANAPTPRPVPDVELWRRKGSNLRMPESKSGALPLGDAPPQKAVRPTAQTPAGNPPRSSPPERPEKDARV